MKSFLRFAAVAVALALPAVGVVYDEFLASKPESTCTKQRVRDRNPKGKTCPVTATSAMTASKTTTAQTCNS